MSVSQIPAASGAGSSAYDGTVATSGGTYASVKAALDAGKRNLLMTGDAADAVAFTESYGGWSLHLQRGATWTHSADLKHVYDGADAIRITGDDREACKIVWSQTSATQRLFDRDSNAGFMTLDGVELDNSASTQAECRFSDALQDYEDIKLTLPDVARGGLQGGGGTGVNARNRFSNVKATGGGTSCSGAIYPSSTVSSVYTDINLQDGTFSTTVAVVSIGPSDIMFGLTKNSSGVYEISVGGELHGYYSGQDTTLILTGTGSVIGYNRAQLGSIELPTNTGSRRSYVNFANGRIDDIVGSFGRCKLENGVVQSAVAETIEESIFVDMVFEALVTTTGNDNIFRGCHFEVGAVNAGDRNKYQTCTFGDRGNSGQAYTLTINAGSDDTILEDCSVDSAVVDNGSTTVNTRVKLF